MTSLERAMAVVSVAFVAACGSGGAHAPSGSAGAAGPAGATGSTGAAGMKEGATGGAGTGGQQATGGAAGAAGASAATGGAGAGAMAGAGGAAGSSPHVDGGAGASAAAGYDAAPPADAHPADGGACSATADPLKTWSTRNDVYDCTILDLAARYGHPDPMMVKAQVAQESSFQIFSISPDSPCGTHAGWTDAESKSFGLIQVTPACGEATAALLPDGHPNLTMDMQSPMWATSVFNPDLNLGEGVKSITGSLKALRTKYPGCTDAQYVLMSAGAFNSGDNAVTGCAMFNTRAQNYVTAVLGHYGTFAKAAGWPNPY
jgi:hypothetical protein